MKDLDSIRQPSKSFLDNPILGIGVGNWEIESVKYDRKEMDDYIVPYHAHNDYLEILAESGIPALIFYFGVLFFMIFIILKKFLARVLKKKKTSFLLLYFAQRVYIFWTLCLTSHRQGFYPR